MAFKYKQQRLKIANEIKTLDELHNEKINKFEETQSLITIKKRKIISLKNKLEDLDKNIDIDLIDKIKRKIDIFEKDLLYLETSFDELDYFERTKDILIEYFDNKSNDNSADIPNEIETKNIDTGQEDDDDKDISDDNDEILSRFNKLNDMNNQRIKKKPPSKKRHQPKLPEKKSITQFLSEDNSGNVVKEPIKKMIHEKGKLRDQYLSLTDTSYLCDKVKQSPIKICDTCNKELTLIQSEGILLCCDCGYAMSIIIESEVPCHKDTLNEKRKYPYNPINHLIEKINQFQAKQTTKIPLEIYDIVRKEFKKNMIEMDDVDPELIQKILKKYKLDTYYEHHYLIFSHITGTPPPSLTREDEEDIKLKFKMIEKPFKLYKPKTRDNYLNYSVVLNKIFLIKAVIDNNPQMATNAKYFKLLKSRDKLKKQDNIWRMICKFNNWPFHSSF